MPTKLELTAALNDARTVIDDAKADITALTRQNVSQQGYIDTLKGQLHNSLQSHETTINELRVANTERNTASANLEGAQRLIAKQLARINELEVQLTATVEDLNTASERCERAIADANRADAARIEATERANHHHNELVVARKRLANAIGAVHDLARAADPHPLNPVG